MSDRMKERHTSRNQYIEIVIGIPGKSELTYKVPNTLSAKQHLHNFLQKLGVTDEKTSWEDLYRSNLKNREFGKEAPQNCDSERATIAGRQGASENHNSADKPTPPKTDSSGWFGIAEERIKRYSKAGLALRGARYREGISQKKLAEFCGMSQENLSKMENGKRVIGEKVAKKLAKVLRIDYRLLQG